MDKMPYDMSFHQGWCHLATCGGNVVVAQEPRLECSPIWCDLRSWSTEFRLRFFQIFLRPTHPPKKIRFESPPISHKFPSISQLCWFHCVETPWGNVLWTSTASRCIPGSKWTSPRTMRPYKYTRRTPGSIPRIGALFICFIGPLFTIARLVQINWLAMVYGIR